jgi:hypothetical protein
MSGTSDDLPPGFVIRETNNNSDDLPPGFEIRQPTAASPPSQQRSGPSPMERTVTGAVTGFAAPEAMAALGRGLAAVPIAPVKAAGYGLQAAAPLVRFGGRLMGAGAGAASGLAGAGVETTARNMGAGPQAASSLGDITEIVTGLPAAITRVTKAGRPAAPTVATPEQLRTAVRESGETATAAALGEEGALGSNQLRREMATRRLANAPERQPVEPTAMQQSARQGVQLPEPVNQQQIASGQDVDAQLRRLGTGALSEAEKTQQTVGGAAFDRYRQVAGELQAERPFAQSAQGQALEAQLDDIIAGGEGPLRTSTEQQVRIARDIKNELFPSRPAPQAANANNLDADLAASPLPLQARIRAQQSRNAARVAETPEQRPVDFNVVDVKLRELRQLESNRDFTGYTGVQRENYGSAASLIDDALSNWVGAANYPRAAYAEASQPRNLFRTRLGEALTTREDIPYATGETTPGMFTTPQSRLRGVVFNDADSVRFASELLGEQQVRRLGVQHTSDMLRGKTAEQVTEWLDNPANAFVDAIPGLRGRVNQYAQRLAADEGRSAGMTRLQGQLRTGVDASATQTRQSREALESARGTIESAVRAFENASPTQMANVWSRNRQKLQETGLFSNSELGMLDRMVSRAGENATRQESVAVGRQVAKEIGSRLLNRVTGGAIGIETVRRIFGGF